MSSYLLCNSTRELKAMAPTPHENRFIKLMQFAVGDNEVAQELSIPRKARKLDMVCRFTEAPDYFGALRADCGNRTVLFEHESQLLARHDVASAWVGLAWLLWERVRPREARSKRAQQVPDTTLRPPLAVLVADHAGDALTGAVPTLARTAQDGIWATAQLDDGGLYVIDTSVVKPDHGFAFWSWLGRAADDGAASERLRALLTDSHLSIDSISRLQEAIVNHELPVSDTEHETAAQRLRREGFADGERRGERKGREALLAVAAELAPERVDELARITGLTELRAAVVGLVRGDG